MDSSLVMMAQGFRVDADCMKERHSAVTTVPRRLNANDRVSNMLRLNMDEDYSLEEKFSNLHDGLREQIP